MLLLHRYYSKTMVCILNGNSGIGAQVRNYFCYSICSRHSIRMRKVTNRTSPYLFPVEALHGCEVRALAGINLMGRSRARGQSQ